MAFHFGPTVSIYPVRYRELYFHSVGASELLRMPRQRWQRALSGQGAEGLLLRAMAGPCVCLCHLLPP